jgi:hypothetical protein
VLHAALDEGPEQRIVGVFASAHGAELHRDQTIGALADKRAARYPMPPQFPGQMVETREQARARILGYLLDDYEIQEWEVIE